MPESQHIHRIDKFCVPESARAEFLIRTHEADQVLRGQPGFIQHRVLQQVDGPGRFNFVTIAVWEDAKAMAAAREKIAARYRAIGFEPRVLLGRLGIEADLANYIEIAN